MNRIVQHYELIHDAVQRLRSDHPDVGLKKFICMRYSQLAQLIMAPAARKTPCRPSVHSLEHCLWCKKTCS
jgi:hypothetical protein